MINSPNKIRIILTLLLHIMSTSWINCLAVCCMHFVRWFPCAAGTGERASDRPTGINNTRHTFYLTVNRTQCPLEGVRNQWNSDRVPCMRSYAFTLTFRLRVSEYSTLYIFSFIGISLKSTCSEINNTVACPMRAPLRFPDPASSVSHQTTNEWL